MLQRTVRHPLVFQINQAYEKLILINKEMKKISKIAKLYNLTDDFPHYEVDADLNR